MPAYPALPAQATTGAPQIQGLSFEGVAASISIMIRNLEAAEGRIAGAPPDSQAGLQSQARDLLSRLRTLQQELHANARGPLEGIEEARQHVERLTEEFYGRLASVPRLGATPEATGRDPKFLWLAGGAFAISIGALLWASMASTPKRSATTGLAKIRKVKLVRAIPAK